MLKKKVSIVLIVLLLLTGCHKNDHDVKPEECSVSTFQLMYLCTDCQYGWLIKKGYPVFPEYYWDGVCKVCGSKVVTEETVQPLISDYWQRGHKKKDGVIVMYRGFQRRPEVFAAVKKEEKK